MRVTVKRQVRIGELLAEIEDRYGDRSDLERHLEENPDDWDARVALHDLEAYSDADPDESLRDTRELVLPDTALDRITSHRLELLVEVERAGGSVLGVRELARRLGRDKKNVSEDVQALEQVGLLSVRRPGPGRAHEIRLPGDEIDLHLVEAGA